mgnify:CR=1 FL=1
MKKNKKNKTLLTVLILLLAITIGYAAIATTLKINGSADVKSARWNVYWDENSIAVTSGSVATTQGNEARVTDSGKTQIEYSVELSEPGDFYEFTVDAVNEGSLNAKIAPNGVKNNVYESDGTTPKNLPDYLGYTVKYAENDADVTAGDVLEAKKGNTPTRKKYKVRVWYKTDIDPSTLNESTTETLKLVFEVDYVQGPKVQPIIETWDKYYYFDYDNWEKGVSTEFDDSWIAWTQENTNTNTSEVCAVLTGGTVCLKDDWDCGEIINGECSNSTGYVASKKIELENKGTTCTFGNYDGDLVCSEPDGNISFSLSENPADIFSYDGTCTYDLSGNINCS